MLFRSLGLGHSYSRAKVKFNVNRADNMIIQSIALVDQIDKDLNTLSMRLREWYSYIFPEMSPLVSDHYTYANIVLLLGDRSSITSDESAKEVQTAVEGAFGGKGAAIHSADNSVTATAGAASAVPVDTAALAAKIVAAARRSIGHDVGAQDLVSVRSLAERVVALALYRKQLFDYLHDRMENVAPSLRALVGETVGARLISHAGSLVNLAKAPASTVQILGAEKALFRALKTRGNTPKYGLLFHSTFIGRASAKNKGRMARYLANKCSIASRLDSFSDTPTAAFGEALREQVEERLRFYDTGVAPRKNVDVMAEVSAKLDAAGGKRKRSESKGGEIGRASCRERV